MSPLIIFEECTMADAGRELGELKREVVEARNQAIKTDNQIKNLTLDIKGFEKRFDGLESRVRLSSVGVNLIVAVTIAIAAYVVSSIRIKHYEGEIGVLQDAVKDEHTSAQSKNEDLHTKLADLEKKRRLHDQASEVASQILTLLDNKQEKEAGDLLDKLDLNQLTSLERKMAEKRFVDVRQHQAEVSYRAGRTAAVANNHPEQAIPELRRSLALDPQGRVAGPARYLLATSLWTLKHYDEAEPLLRELAKHEDRGVAEEAQYMLATGAARLDKREEAKAALTQVVSANGRYAASAKAYLNALETGSELPSDLPGGRVRIARKPATGQAVADDNATH
ncbi:MAG TPA: tetratricopeptide repeat protein [Myxococcota bacterium]|nr:tetratricopeptide repeat protein [Myxococcota bacterium]